MQNLRHGVLLLCVMTAGLAQQRNAPTVPRLPLGTGPFILDTAEQHRIRVVILTRGLSHPWGLAFLPDGNMLVTERAGRLRLIRDGVARPKADRRCAGGIRQAAFWPHGCRSRSQVL